MKKLLGLLAVAPMALAACSGTEDTSKGHEVQGELKETAYYLGHGQNKYDYMTDGMQNTSYQLIETNIHEDADGELYYEIHESVAYYRGSEATTVAGDAAAEATWTVVADADQPADDTDMGAEGAQSAADKAAALGWILGADLPTPETELSKYYQNTGESLRYVYDVVSVAFNRTTDKLTDGTADVDFVNKDATTYPNLTQWTATREAWQKHLNDTFGTCDEVNEVTEADLKALGAEKGGTDIAGATLTETGLYVASALTTALTHCKA